MAAGKASRSLPGMTKSIGWTILTRRGKSKPNMPSKCQRAKCYLRMTETGRAKREQAKNSMRLHDIIYYMINSCLMRSMPCTLRNDDTFFCDSIFLGGSLLA